MGYPPAAGLMAIYASGADRGTSYESFRIPERFCSEGSWRSTDGVIGPASPGIGKINDIYRKVIYLKSEDERILMAVEGRMEKYIEINRGFQSLKIQFDMNP